MTTTIQLDVAKAYPNDVGQAIARLDPDAMQHLRLRPGDPIAIEGTDMTVAKAGGLIDRTGTLGQCSSMNSLARTRMWILAGTSRSTESRPR